uniref:Uncharacterized protein n=1 Tax=Arcella intermedia TaxID=1963864 RepID=A0A6B2KZN3_9EUKA
MIPLGKSGVGKTALILRYLHQKFEEPSKTVRTTQHSTIVKIGHEQLNVNIWDVGGKVKKKTTDRCNVYFLCFSVVDETSFHFVKKMYQQLKSQHKEDNYFCLVGCKGDLRHNPNNTPVPEEVITQFAQEIGVPYQETSAKDNTGISTVFNTAFQKKREILIIEQQKLRDQQILEDHLTKKSTLSQIFEISRIRVLYVEKVQHHESIAVQHITMEENVDQLFDYFLMGDIDPKNSPLFECTVLLLRSQTQLLKHTIINSPRILHRLMTQITTPDYSKLTDRTRSIFIDFLQGLTKSHLNSLIQFLNRFPLDYNKEYRNNGITGKLFSVNGVVPEGEIVFLRHLMMECADEGKLKLVTEILNADQKLSIETGNPSLIQRCDLGNTFLVILQIPSGISIVDGIFKQVVKIYGTSSQLVLKTITFDDYCIPKIILQYICQPDTCDDAVTFCIHLLSVHKDNQASLLPFHTILVSHSHQFAQLLTSNSLRLRHAALLLTEHLIKLSYHSIALPLLPASLDLFFSEPRGNVIHHLVTSIFTEILSSGISEIQSFVISELQFPFRIMKAFEEDDGIVVPNVMHLVSPRKSKEYFGHLAEMVKAIEEAPLGGVAEGSVLATEEWRRFKGRVLQERKERELFPPSSEMRLKNRQGSVIVLPRMNNGSK